MADAITGMCELFEKLERVTDDAQQYVRELYVYIAGNVDVSEKSGINIPNIIRLVGYTMKYNKLRKLQAVLLELKQMNPSAVKIIMVNDRETLTFASNIEGNVTKQLKEKHSVDDDFLAPPIVVEKKIVSNAKKFTEVSNMMDLLQNHATSFLEFEGLNIITHLLFLSLICDYL